MKKSSEVYDVEVSTQLDGNAMAMFIIRPALTYISDERAAGLSETVRQLVLSRMAPDEADGLHLGIYHNLADGSGTVGYARFEGLRRATGAIVLQQALELGLNGSNDYISESSPLRQ